MNQHYADTLRGRYEAIEEREEKNAALRERVRLVKKNGRYPLWYSFGFSAIVIIYSINITMKVAIGGFVGASAYAVGMTMVGIALLLVGLAFLSYCKTDCASLILIALYAVLSVLGIEAIGGSNTMWSFGSVGEVLGEEGAKLTFDYSVPLTVLGALGVVAYIYAQKLKNEYEYLKSLDGFPHFNERVIRKEYIPYDRISPEERGAAVMDELPPVTVDDSDFAPPPRAEILGIDELDTE